MKLDLPNKKTLPNDLLAGFTVAIVSITNGLAFSALIGIDAAYGLYSGMLATIVGSLFVSSTLMIISLGSDIALIIATSLGTLGSDLVTGIVTLSLVAGIVQLAMGLLKLGKFVRYISFEVITGYISASAVLLILSQIEKLTGYPSNVTSQYCCSIVSQSIDTMLHVNLWNLSTLVLGMVFIICLYFLGKSRIKSFATLLMIIVATVIVALFNLESVQLVGDFGTIPPTLPTPISPDFSLLPVLILPAVAIGILSMIETASITTTYPNPSGKAANVSKNIISQGLANIAGFFTTSMPVNAAINRTATNVTFGAQTRWSGVYSGLIVASAILIFSKFFEQIPLVSLAGFLVIVGYELLKTQIPKILLAWKSSKFDYLIIMLILVIGVGYSLVAAVFIEIIISIIVNIEPYPRDQGVLRLIKLGEGRFEEKSIPKKLPSNQITIIQTKSPNFYPIIYFLQKKFSSIKQPKNAVIIINMRGGNYFSKDIIQLLGAYAYLLKNRGNKLMLADVSEILIEKLKKTGAADDIGIENIFEEKTVPLASIDEAIEEAKNWIKKRSE